MKDKRGKHLWANEECLPIIAQSQKGLHTSGIRGEIGFQVFRVEYWISANGWASISIRSTSQSSQSHEPPSINDNGGQNWPGDPLQAGQFLEPPNTNGNGSRRWLGNVPKRPTGHCRAFQGYAPISWWERRRSQAVTGTSAEGPVQGFAHASSVPGVLFSLF